MNVFIDQQCKVKSSRFTTVNSMWWSGKVTYRGTLVIAWLYKKAHAVEPSLRGHLEERPSLLERPYCNKIFQHLSVLISAPNERPSLFKGHISVMKRHDLTRGVPLNTLEVRIISGGKIYWYCGRTTQASCGILHRKEGHSHHGSGVYFKANKAKITP